MRYRTRNSIHLQALTSVLNDMSFTSYVSRDLLLSNYRRLLIKIKEMLCFGSSKYINGLRYSDSIKVDCEAKFI